MRFRFSALIITTAVLFYSTSASADAICRDLYPGDKHHPKYTRCCDASSGGSWWTEANGTRTHNGNKCSNWGVTRNPPTIYGLPDPAKNEGDTVRAAQKCQSGAIQTVSPNIASCRYMAEEAGVEGGRFHQFIAFGSLGPFEQEQFEQTVRDIKLRKPAQFSDSNFNRVDSGYCFICYDSSLENDESTPEEASNELAPACPTRRCGGAFSASRPTCLALNNGAGACPVPYHSKDKYGCCKGW